MFETKQQKNYLITVIVLILILSLVTFWSPSRFRPKKNVESNNQTEDTYLKSKAYLDYLKNLKIDRNASKALFQELITEDDIKKEVEGALQTNQKITPPKIDESTLNISDKKGKEAVVNYFSEVVSKTLEYNNNFAAAQNLFSGTIPVRQDVYNNYIRLNEDLKKVEIPKEMLGLHKAMLISYSSYGDLMDISNKYTLGQKTKPWPELYRDYVIINDQAKKYKAGINSLAKKYDIASIPVTVKYAGGEIENINIPFIKTAYAGFLPGLPDISITIGDIPSLIWKGIQEGLVSSFSQFMAVMLSNVLEKIESNYLVSNFLYYTDALVSGQYAEDYLKKYVPNTFDKEIIRAFIPQFSCGAGNEYLRPIFQAKAMENLGFDPELLSPDDPNYYTKMARVGDFLSSPQGWEIVYKNVADKTVSEAEKAASQELLSPGLKVPRDSVGKAIKTSVNSIVSAQKAAFQAMFDLGTSNAEFAISSFVSNLTQNLINKFVFKGASSANGVIGVLKEQATCLAAAQLNVVLPAGNVEYAPPPPPPTTKEVFTEECKKNPSLCAPQSYTDYESCLNQEGDPNYCCDLFPNESVCF